MDDKGDKRLFSDFEQITTREWEEKINDELKGTDYEKKINGKTDEGIHIKPFYREEDLASLDYLGHTGALKNRSGAPNGWKICQDIFPRDFMTDANRRIKLALENGAEVIRIQLNDSRVLNADKLGELLNGIPLGETELHFQGYPGADSLYENLCNIAGLQGVDPSKLKGSLGADPIGMMAASGIPIASFENLGLLVKRVRKNSPSMRIITINSALIQNAGSTLSEEVAFGMSMASEYMALLTDQGIEPHDAQEAMQFSMAVGPDYFMEVAKLRAVRILWSRISEAYGGGHARSKILIHSTSSEWNLTCYDPHVNMLRGTSEAMSSVIGGSDIVSVLPFDYPYGTTTDFSDRIARNIQIILREEAYFDRVSDPASGSYYIEKLTDSLGGKSWGLFQKVEELGGFRKAFETGWIQEQVDASRRMKTEEVSSGRRKILGTNSYPGFNEFILDKFSQTSIHDSIASPIIPLQPFRISSHFEEVRLETEKAEKRPSVLLFKIGHPSWMTARASFSASFFACAGYEIIDPPAYQALAEGIQSALEIKADIVVLCSSDDRYIEIVPEIIRSLNKKTLLVVAGYPSETIEPLRGEGIEYFIHLKCNHLETLKTFNNLLLHEA